MMKKEEKLLDNIKPEMIGEKRYARMAEGAKRYSVGLNTFRNMTLVQRRPKGGVDSRATLSHKWKGFDFYFR